MGQLSVNSFPLSGLLVPQCELLGECVCVCVYACVCVWSMCALFQ